MVFATLSSIQQQLTQPGAPFELAKDAQTQLTYYKNAPQTLAQMLQAARREDDDIFLVYGDDRWSFARFYDAVDRVASYLQAQHVTPGQRVAIAMRNRPEWAVFFVASVYIGAIPAPLNSFGLGDELSAAINDINADVLVCDDARLKRLQNTEQCLPSQVICLYGDMAGDISPEISRQLSRSNHANSDPDTTSVIVDANEVLHYADTTWQAPDIDTNSPALILFTSGATSRAKAVESSNKAVCQALYNINYITAISAMSSPDIVQSIQAKGLPPVALTAVPLFHVSGLHAQLLNGLLSSRRLVFLHKWDTDSAIDVIEQEQVTVFNGAPAMIMQMMRNKRFVEGKAHQQLVGLGFGGAGIPKKLINNVLERMSDKMVGIGYGMTETNGAGAAGSGAIFNSNPSASGIISPIMQVRIKRDDGSVAVTGERGEIQLKGVTLMNGYLDAEHGLTKAVDNDGWLSTGDIGYIDENDYIYVVDRIKDVINRAGENVSAAEVECCLLHHEDVIEVGVTGIPDDNLGEAVVAVVNYRQGSKLDEDSLKAFCAEHLAAFKVPCKVVFTDQKLPRNPAGKLLKSELKQHFVSTLA
ncbi:class I adenylate-forming enzyme family protein [Thalassotalea ponticola]|uniref:class I adenylate-forming enzyme family protein n=1 Tax=Thalassotalea ponticola TaxID=1523392 RepID=UPI0025B44B2E|nr:class I adenylate-forming enzyme family protein [Thalassotalea ponticola]MDN3653440.1 class I adenylate-forming enzyme family protein [Thalassotalea ponticola]